MHPRQTAVAICLLAAAWAQTNPSTSGTAKNPTPMTQHAKGTFEVKLTPQKADNDVAQAANFGRYSIDKQFHGDLEGTSKGEMIGAQTETKGSAGYVAMERV